MGKATAEPQERCILQPLVIWQKQILAVQSLVGIKLGQQIHEFANGIDNTPVLAEGEDAKGYSSSTTLEEDVRTTDEAYRILLALTDM